MKDIREVYETLQTVTEQYQRGRYLGLPLEGTALVFTSDQDNDWMQAQQPQLEAAGAWIADHVLDVLPGRMAECVYWSETGELKLEIEMSEAGRLVYGKIWKSLEAGAEIAVQRELDGREDTIEGKVYRLYKKAEAEIDDKLNILFERCRKALSKQGIEIVPDEDESGIYRLRPEGEEEDTKSWLAKALDDIEAVDERADEREWKRIPKEVRCEARRILSEIAKTHPSGPNVLFGATGSLTLEFTTPFTDIGDRLLIRLEPSGEAVCDWRHKTVAWKSSEHLPNDFINRRLAAMGRGGQR